MSISTAQIIKIIGCDKLSLCKGSGYWYFVYDDLDANGIFETRSVYIFKLNRMSLESWVVEGQEFVDYVQGLKK